MPPPEGIKRIGEALWELPPTLRPGMLVPVRVFATEDLVRAMDDAVFQQQLGCGAAGERQGC